MKRINCFLACFLLFNAISFSDADCKDIIRLPQPKSQSDSRFQYPDLILKMALNASVDKYGPFEIVNTSLLGNRNRMLKELQEGKTINVHSAPTRPEWEEKALPIMFPIMKGLLSYRIFLIHQDNVDKFKQVESIEDLKKLSAGVGAQWSTTKSLRELGGFKIETGTNYEGLFNMLMAKRFDYFIRGVNEAFTEYAQRKNKYPQMMIEPYLAMELPLPWFFFVSPQYAGIAERIEYGLQKMKADGSFEKEFYRFHGETIKKANLNKRKLFRVKNLRLTPHEIYDDPSYWLDITKLNF